MICRTRPIESRLSTSSEKKIGKERREYWSGQIDVPSLYPFPKIAECAPERPDITHIAEKFEKDLTPERAAQLIAQLGLPKGAVDLLPLFGVGWRPTITKARSHSRSYRQRVAWTIPEIDSKGRVIGLQLRHFDGSKKQLPDSSRGLNVSKGCLDKAERVRLLLIAEGFSDALTFRAAGIPAIGRPSNVGGVDALVELLKDLHHEVQIIVVGENDFKPLRNAWPGRTGAYQTADKLAQKLKRTIHWGMVPGVYRPKDHTGKRKGKQIEYKDSREWFTDKAAGKESPVVWEKLGNRFVADLRKQLDKCDPETAEEPLLIADTKCTRPHHRQLEGNPNSIKRGSHAACDFRCRRLCSAGPKGCPGCRAWNINRWQSHLFMCILFFCHPAAFRRKYGKEQSLNEQTLIGPDTSGVGPWPLYAMIGNEKEIHSVKNGLSQRNSLWECRVHNFVKVELPALSVQSDGDCGPTGDGKDVADTGVTDSWPIVGIKKYRSLPTTGQEKLKDQEKLFLLVAAINPTVRPPKGLKRVDYAEGIELLETAILNMPEGPVTGTEINAEGAEVESESSANQTENGKADTRFRPITATPHWRPPDDRERTGNWKAGRKQSIPAAHARRLSRKAGIEVPRSFVMDAEDSTIWHSSPARDQLFSIMIAGFALGTTDNDFIRRLDKWNKLIEGIPLGPNVFRELEIRTHRLPYMGDKTAIEQAVRQDVIDAESRESMREGYEMAEALKHSPCCWRNDPKVCEEINRGLALTERINKKKKQNPCTRARHLRTIRTQVARRIEQHLQGGGLLAELQIGEAIDWVMLNMGRLSRSRRYDSYRPPIEVRKRLAAIDLIMKTIGK